MKTVVPINDTIDVTAAPTMDDLQSNGKKIRSAKLDAMIRILHLKLANSSLNGMQEKVWVTLDIVLTFVAMLKKVFSNSPGTSCKPSDDIRSDQTPLHTAAKHKRL